MEGPPFSLHPQPNKRSFFLRSSNLIVILTKRLHISVLEPSALDHTCRTLNQIWHRRHVILGDLIMIMIASFVHSSSNSSDSQPSKCSVESKKQRDSGEVIGGGEGAEQSVDEEAELLVELAVDDVEVAVLLVESLHFFGCLAEASEVQATANSSSRSPCALVQSESGTGGWSRSRSWSWRPSPNSYRKKKKKLTW